jgi:hypothetical protein
VEAGGARFNWPLEVDDISTFVIALRHGPFHLFGHGVCILFCHRERGVPQQSRRCAECKHILLRLVKARERVFIDMRGMTCLILDRSQLQVSSG